MSCSIKFRSVPVILASFLFLFLASESLADPCLVVYPDEVCTYHYDTSEYYTVSMGHPLYDPEYDRGGEVLIEVGTDEIDLTIYQAPNLAGFEPSSHGEDGYFLIGYDFNLVVDGWSDQPTTYVNVLLVFDTEPSSCEPIVTVDGNTVYSHPQLGLYYPIGDLVVTTPIGSNNYSDTVTQTIHWELCSGLRVWAFADEDYDYQRDGTECFSAFSHDVTIPVEKTTWSRLKALFGKIE